jgi:SpoVK/Ycf46/Vps4 family AAA+-type ATPase
LINNIDTAFERRFLFKIEFSKPTIENRSKIWKLKINQLTDSECMLIAQAFDFSGGQIENITRKYNLFEVINGCLPTLKDVMGFCESEKMGATNHSAVGFVLNSNNPS